MTLHVAALRNAGVAALCVVASAVYAAPPLRLCALAHNLPYSAREGARGFDVEVAANVAQALARPFEAVWIDNPEVLQEIDDSDFPVHRLRKGACDAIFSMPGPARDTLKNLPGLALGSAYYGAAFELFGPPGTPPYLKALKARDVAIQAQTVASFAIAFLHGKQRTYFVPRAALEGVTRGEADVALLWGPTAGWQLRQLPALDLAIVEGYAPPAALAWNLHVATRAADPALREAIDTALDAMTRDGMLAKIAADYGIPWHAPFPVTYSLTELNKLR